MSKKDFSKGYKSSHGIRFQKTLDFTDSVIPKGSRILDIGVENPMSELLKANGYKVQNTKENDLDLEFDSVKEDGFDVVTAFEILEHLVSPFPLLHAIRAEKLIVSVPLKLWFSKAYWNQSDPYDRHYHEFEPQQLDMLLNKAGWNILKREKWKGQLSELGIRPLLRKFTYRYYIVYCERSQINGE